MARSGWDAAGDAVDRLVADCPADSMVRAYLSQAIYPVVPETEVSDLQIFSTCVVCVVMSEIGKLFLEGQERSDFFRDATGTNRNILEICVDMRLLLAQESRMGNVKLLFRVPSRFLMMQQAPQPVQPGRRLVHRYHPGCGPQCHSVPERALCARVSAALRNGVPV